MLVSYGHFPLGVVILPAQRVTRGPMSAMEAVIAPNPAKLRVNCQE